MAELDTGYSVKEDHNNNGDYEAHSTAYGLNQRVIEASENADVQEEMQNRVDGFNQRDTTLQRFFLITNFVVELPSAVFDQLSSVHKPQYALISMIMSFIILLISVIDLARMGGRKRVKWMRRGLIPWFYSSYPSYKPLGSFVDIVGLVCGILQCVFATIAYAFLSKHADNPIKISVWPLIFAFGVLCSRFPRNNPHTISVLERVEIHPNSPAQGTLQGLHPSETPLLFNNTIHYKELSEMAEMAKRRAEIARLREFNTLKGRVESLVRRKGLDIDTILQRQYSF